MEDIESGLAGDLNDLLSAAEQIAGHLGAPDGGEYARWLQETVAKLEPEDCSVLDALRDLDVVLATTNYDHLLEISTGWPTYTWKDEAMVESVLRGETKGILHLHGAWDRPDTTILGIRSYAEIRGHEHTQAALRAVAMAGTFLFVGCGAGLEDPNFGRLLEWMQRVLAASPYRHYLLCLEKDLPELRRQYPPAGRIVPLAYGEKHADLAPFLRSLRPPVCAGTPTPAFLPGRPDCFGRDKEREALAAHLVSGDAHPALLLGGPGIGKSTLALAALHDERVAARFGARRWFVRCDAAKSRSDVAAALALALGLPLSPGVDVAVLTALAAAPAALVLDNLETPWEADAQPVEDLLSRLAGAPGLAFAATLRGGERPFGIAWRSPFSLRPLELPDARTAFLAVAGERFAADAHLKDLLLAVDCVPLAITLLAHAAQAEPDLSGLLRRWQARRTAMLRLPGRTHRLENLDVSLALSVDGPRMTPEARRLLALLGILPAGIAHADLDALLPGAGEDAAFVLRQVGLALDAPGRLRVLAPVREYARAYLPPDSADLDACLTHYLALARRGNELGRQTGADAAARLEPETANVEEMLLAALAGGRVSDAIAAAPAWGKFVSFTGVGSGSCLAAAAKAARTAGAVLGEGHCIGSLGDIALYRSDHAGARARYEEALPLFRKVGHVPGEANCIARLGDIALRRSDHAGARARYEEALPLYRQVGAVLGEANCHLGVGDVARACSDTAGAKTAFEEALRLYGKVGHRQNAGLAHRRLARVAGTEDERRRHVDAARAAWESIDRPDLVAELDEEFGGRSS